MIAARTNPSDHSPNLTKTRSGYPHCVNSRLLALAICAGVGLSAQTVRAALLCDNFLVIDVEDHPSDKQKRIMGGGQIADVMTVPETIGK
jgi:hypothetical protein